MHFRTHLLGLANTLLISQQRPQQKMPMRLVGGKYPIMDPPGFTEAVHPSEVRIVLLGKTGVGKSATGNTILGQDVFQTDLGFSSVSMKCQERTVPIGQHRVRVVDTPDFYATHSQEGLSSEIERCISLSEPGPHAFLCVLTPHTFTEKETDAVSVFDKCVGEVARKYTFIVFTHGDELTYTTIKELVEINSKLTELIQKCGWRFHVINNKNRANRQQLTELLETIPIMMNANDGGFYSIEMLHETKDTVLREEERKIEKEREDPRSQLEKDRREIEERVMREEEKVREMEEGFRRNRGELENKSKKLEYTRSDGLNSQKPLEFVFVFLIMYCVGTCLALYYILPMFNPL